LAIYGLKIPKAIPVIEEPKPVPIKPIPKLKVVADSREVPSKVIDLLREMHVDVEIQTLDVADYIISSKVAVERKEAADFALSLGDGRLFTQIRNMKELYEVPVVMIEGTIAQTRLSYKAIVGAITSLIVDWRVPVLFTSDIGDSAEFLRSMAYREQVERARGIIVHRGKKPEPLDEIQRFIVAGYPGISGEISHRIMLHFKTIKDFVNAAVSELVKVEGLGKKKANRIIEVNTKEYKPTEKE